MKSECYFSFKLKNKGVLNRFTDSSSLTPEIEGDLDAILGCVFSSVNRIPLQLKRLFSEIKRLCVQRFPDDPNVVFLVHILELSLLLLLLLLTSPFLQSVSGFLFLRFLCPAIVSPAVFGILEDVPDVESARVFKAYYPIISCLGETEMTVFVLSYSISLARYVQYLANLKAEPTDQRMKEYLEENLSKMKGFLEL